MEEIWRDIAGYEGLYQVSNFGRVKSFYNGGQIMKTPPSSNGYLHVALRRDGAKKFMLIHRLVAEAFIPNPDGKSQVNHINGDKTDNHVGNLEWTTPLENTRHAAATGLLKSGKDRSDAKLTNEQVRFIRDNPDDLNIMELARLFGVCFQTISKIQLGGCYKSAGGQIRNKIERRLPDDAREQIKRLYKSHDKEFGAIALAKRFGVTSETIQRIVNEK